MTRPGGLSIASRCSSSYRTARGISSGSIAMARGSGTSISTSSPARTDRLREFLVRGRAHRLLIALHETELLERENPRLLVLLRQFPMSIEIHRTVAQARNASDPCVIADDHSVWHQLHFERPRAIVALHSPADALPIAQRFDEIWELSEPAVSSTTLGL